MQNEARLHSSRHSSSPHFGARHGAGQTRSKHQWPSPPYKPSSCKPEHGYTHERIYMNPYSQNNCWKLCIQYNNFFISRAAPVNLNDESELLSPSASFQTSISIDLTLNFSFLIDTVSVSQSCVSGLVAGHALLPVSPMFTLCSLRDTQ